MRKEERPVNKTEGMLYDIMSQAGWHITKRGWPDFICRKEDRIVAIEVKSKRSHKLKSEQLEMLLLLAKLGVECYRWTPVGFELVTPVMGSLDKPNDFHVTKRVYGARRAGQTKQVKSQQPSINKSLGLLQDVL